MLMTPLSAILAALVLTEWCTLGEAEIMRTKMGPPMIPKTVADAVEEFTRARELAREELNRKYSEPPPALPEPMPRSAIKGPSVGNWVAMALIGGTFLVGVFLLAIAVTIHG